MAEIKSERDFEKFYLAITGFVSFFLIMALVVFALHGQALSKFGEVIMIITSLLLVFMAFYTVFRYHKNAPLFVVDDEAITFNNAETYFWKDLEKIELTGKTTFKFINGDQKECITLKFKEGVERYIFDDMYSNMPEIKTFIEQAVINKPLFEPLPVIDSDRFGVQHLANNHQRTPEIKTVIQQIVTDKSPFEPLPNGDSEQFAAQHFAYYYGRQYFCFEGIILWVFLLLTMLMEIKAITLPSIGGIVGFLIFGGIWFLILGLRIYYFGLSENYLVVKLHNIFWFNETYLLSDIKEIVFEKPYKMPVCLRVITNDFESKRYPAASLGSKKWLELKDNLERNGIKVRNECVSL